MHNGKFIIRETTLDDLSAINAIQNHVIDTSDSYLSDKHKTHSQTLSWFEEHQNSDYYVVLSALLDEQFVGWVSLSPFRDINGYDISAELSVYVHPNYHRQGIAEKLMQAIELFAIQKQKLHSIISLITANNLPSIALHQKMNYQTAGLLKEIAIKNNKLQDVVLMTKLLEY